MKKYDTQWRHNREAIKRKLDSFNERHNGMGVKRVSGVDLWDGWYGSAVLIYVHMPTPYDATVAFCPPTGRIYCGSYEDIFNRLPKYLQVAINRWDRY